MLGSRQVSCQIQGLFCLLAAFLFIAQLCPRPRQHSMHQRELRVRSRGLFQKVLGSKSVELAEPGESERIKLCRFRVQWQCREHTRFLEALQLLDAQAVAQLSANS